MLEHLFVDDQDDHITHNFLFMFGVDVENQIQHIMSRSSQRDNVQRDGQVVEAQNVYNDKVFQCHYQMRYLLVLKFLKLVITRDMCFAQGKDSFGNMDLPLQKCMDFIKMFAYGVLTNAIDEYCL